MLQPWQGSAPMVPERVCVLPDIVRKKRELSKWCRGPDIIAGGTVLDHRSSVANHSCRGARGGRPSGNMYKEEHSESLSNHPKFVTYIFFRFEFICVYMTLMSRFALSHNIEEPFKNDPCKLKKSYGQTLWVTLLTRQTEPNHITSLAEITKGPL